MTLSCHQQLIMMWPAGMWLPQFVFDSHKFIEPQARHPFPLFKMYFLFNHKLCPHLKVFLQYSQNAFPCAWQALPLSYLYLFIHLSNLEHAIPPWSFIQNIYPQIKILFSQITNSISTFHVCVSQLGCVCINLSSREYAAQFPTSLLAFR